MPPHSAPPDQSHRKGGTSRARRNGDGTGRTFIWGVQTVPAKLESTSLRSRSISPLRRISATSGAWPFWKRWAAMCKRRALPYFEGGPPASDGCGQDKCTICGSCAFVCPTGALGLGDGGSTLYGRESACIRCALCAHACPEDALALLPVVPMDDRPRLLARSEVKGCTRCGRPLLPGTLVRRIENKLRVRMRQIALPCDSAKAARERRCSRRRAPSRTLRKRHLYRKSQSLRAVLKKDRLETGTAILHEGISSRSRRGSPSGRQCLPVARRHPKRRSRSIATAW